MAKKRDSMCVSKRFCSVVPKLQFVMICFFSMNVSKAASLENNTKQGLESLETCSKQAGGGFCPAGNTCCRLHDDDKSGCIPNNVSKDKLGVCCPNRTTGCAHGYSCSSNNKCVRDYSIEPSKVDPLAEVLPRYKLCSPPDGSLNTVYGLPVPNIPQRSYPQNQHMEDNVNLKTSRHRQATTVIIKQQQTAQYHDDKIPKAIYHSTHGDIISTNSFPKIKMAFIIVHGAGRNADDYFCSATAASSLQTVYSKEELLVLSPRFVSPKDSLHHLSNDLKESEILKWEFEIDGTWRYGASPVAPPYATTLSSYDVMDEFIQVLANKTKFPLLERISVAGHSSGGQFVQRWSLTSSSFVWNDDHRQIAAIGTSSTAVSSDETTTLLRSSSSFYQTFQPKLFAIVANPSSYAYLDDRRYIHGMFQVPPFDMQQSCPTYNKWEWGLDVFTSSTTTKSNNTLDMENNNDDVVPYPRHVPYVSEAIMHTDGIHNLAKRYIKRNVVYLAGSLDRCNITRQPSLVHHLPTTSSALLDTNEYWCDSHGLETTCVDEIQGSNRWERSKNYFSHLKEYFQIGEEDEMFRHERWIVDDVGHDPSLMFTSDVGLKAIFGG